jgi:hypothetical protein
LEQAAGLIGYGITERILVNGEFRFGFHPFPPPPHDSSNLRILNSTQRATNKRRTLTEMLQETNFFCARLPV